jgi:starch phosphorylase
MKKKQYTARPMQKGLDMDIDGFNMLAELALDMRWSWNYSAEDIWRKIDPYFWENSNNPWSMLQTVSHDEIRRVLTDTSIRKKIETLYAQKQKAAETAAWFQKTYPEPPLKCITYFCMEFMLSEALPIYSGGLGNVAGDQLKAASDLGVPVVGIGLLYQKGYFRQVIDKNGAQDAYFTCNDFWQLPVTPLRAPTGEWLRLKLDIPNLPVWLRVWQVEVGRVKLYLLDSNDGANYPPFRAITSELYGGDKTNRFMQEAVLGIGGWQLVTALGLEPEVCHLNEGHAAFAILARARSFMKKSSQPFEVALAITRMGNLFTTHTAVEAGFDRFEPALIEQYLGDYATRLGISTHDLLALGRQDANNDAEDFNMAYLAIRGSGSVNGVSRLHGRVSRHLFQPLFPRWPVDEVPVAHVTNGIHVPSWDSEAAVNLWIDACGKKVWLDTAENMEKHIRGLPDDVLWKFRLNSSRLLIDFTRDRLAWEREISGEPQAAVDEAKNFLSPNALTLGFARRFATYKRPDLLLHDKERLLRLFSNTERPVQLIFAGKAHPADLPGQALIKEWIEFIRNHNLNQKIIFLSDYDMLLTKQLVKGVDVWLNTPRRPWEASGTSGMKVLVNGGLNLSELDGWWAEAYTPEVGWALGDGKEHGDDPGWDHKEAEDLYNILENEVIPEFYTRNKEGFPTAWITRMRESMALLTPRFSANRVVRQYLEEHYVPAAKKYKERVANSATLGDKIVNWGHAINHHWASLRFGELKIKSQDNKFIFEIPFYYNDLDPDYVRIELYANGIDDGEPLRLEMTRLNQSPDTIGSSIYSATVPANRNADDFTVRAIPHCDGVSIPLESTNILWQR